ncbi:MAG TPA: segregation/condensation protein A [Terriglobia bacterium]|nr:segregation/condensation protein A [Terriglobia bacterium]
MNEIESSPAGSQEIESAAQESGPGPAAKRATRAAEPAPAVKLEIYQGPLDLLLDLIRKQQINIYDIPIAKITKQYLDYIHLLEEMNIDVAGEFIFMAATLIYIKSRMLLPPDPSAPPEEQEDPRTDLVHRLLEHEQFKNAAQMLASKRMVEDAAWTQPGIGEFVEAEDEPGFTVTVYDLVSVFREIIERARKRPQMEIHREQVSVAQMVEHVKAVLAAHPHPVRLDDLFAGYVARQALIALLLALLEMVRLHAVILRQKDLFAPIVVHKNKRLEEIMAGVSVAQLEASFEEAVPSDPGPLTAESDHHAE